MVLDRGGGPVYHGCQASFRPKRYSLVEDTLIRYRDFKRSFEISRCRKRSSDDDISNVLRRSFLDYQPWFLWRRCQVV